MLNLARATQLQLTVLADAEIHRVLTGQTGMPAPLDAREAIGATVSSALPAAADAWRGVLQSLGVKIQAICAFSFGSPIVAFQHDGVVRRCGLGVVLVIIDDLSGPVADRRALLLSAPRAPGEAGALEAAQRHLYARWPAFQFEDRLYCRELRDLGSSQKAATHSHGDVARIDLSTPAPAWILSDPAQVCGGRSPRGLGSKLVAMAVGAAGRKATPGGSDDWSRTVDELLRRTAAATVHGLRSHPGVRSTTTYRGDCGSGLVVFENPTVLPIESALAEADACAASLVEGPISVVHFAFKRLRRSDDA